MIDFSQFDSLISMTMYFNNEDTCKQAIIETRWGVGDNQDVVCPYCGEHHCVTRKDGIKSLKGVPFSALNLQAAYTNWFGIFASIACLARFSPNFCFALLKFSKIFITLHRIY